MEQKISDELKAMRKILEYTPLEMAFVLKEDLQTYNLYENGKFDGTYSIRKDHLRAKLILMVELFEDRIVELKEAKVRLIKYKSNGAKSSGVTGRKSNSSVSKKLNGKQSTKPSTRQYAKPGKQA